MEKYVEIKKHGKIMRGMMHIPDASAAKEKFPGVIMYHGFTGNRLEPSSIFVRFSRFLADHGIASVRFDFMNSGESDGSFENMTLSGEIEDAEDILSWFLSREIIDKNNVFLLGLSMGGSIAGYVAGKHSSELKGLILWSPAGEMSLFIEEREKQIEEGTITGDPMDLGGLRLGEDFISDVKKLVIFEKTALYKGPAAIIHGTGDSVVPPDVSREYKRILGDRATLTFIEDADHTYQSIPWSKTLFTTSMEFLNANIKNP